MPKVNCIVCGKEQTKRTREDNGFNFCCKECEDEGWFKYGYKTKNPYFIIKDLAFVLTKDSNNNLGGIFIIDKFNLWILNLGSWHLSHGYVENNYIGKLHRLLNNTSDEFETDHINTFKECNTLRNLRSSTRELNNRNKNIRKDSKSRLTGIYYVEDVKLWKVQIFNNNKNIKLGEFINVKDAIVCRISAELKYWGFSKTEYNKDINYLDIYMNNKNKFKKGVKLFIGISPNGKKFLYDNQREFSDMFNLDKKLLNLVLKERQKSHRGWKFKYFNNECSNLYKDLRLYSYAIGVEFNKKINTKHCGCVVPISKFDNNNNIAVVFDGDKTNNKYYFSKSDILNGNCHIPKFVQINNGIVGQVYVKKDSPYYNLWLKFLEHNVKLDWVYNFKLFKDNIKLLNSFSRDDLFKDVIYFDFSAFVFRYRTSNKIRIKKKVSDQYNFVGIKDNNVYLFDNQNEVARKYGLDTGGICRCLSSKYKQTKGWSFFKRNLYGKLPTKVIDERIYAKGGE